MRATRSTGSVLPSRSATRLLAWDHQAAYGVIFGAAQLQQPPPPPPLVLLPWRAQRGLVLLHGRLKASGTDPFPNHQPFVSSFADTIPHLQPEQALPTTLTPSTMWRWRRRPGQVTAENTLKNAPPSVLGRQWQSLAEGRGAAACFGAFGPPRARAPLPPGAEAGAGQARPSRSARRRDDVVARVGGRRRRRRGRA
jgi:hypothetical protein